MGAGEIDVELDSDLMDQMYVAIEVGVEGEDDGTICDGLDELGEGDAVCRKTIPRSLGVESQCW